MKTIKIIMLLFCSISYSAFGFNLALDRSYGVSNIEGTPYVFREEKLTILVPVMEHGLLELKQTQEGARQRGIIEEANVYDDFFADLKLAADWINKQLGENIIEILRSTSGRLDFEDCFTESGLTTLCYFPDQDYLMAKKGESLHGQTQCYLYPQFFWQQNFTIKSASIFIYVEHENEYVLGAFRYELFQYTVRHEILHALGFDHASRGVMYPGPESALKMRHFVDFIDEEQLENWKLERKTNK